MAHVTRLKLGVRSGLLARSEAEEIVDALGSAHPGVEIEVVRMGSTGDHVHDRARGGAFTAELDDALRDGRVDVALHDLPDLPGVRPDAFVLVAVPRRRHPFDVLLTLDGRILDELEEKERVAASTLSRRSQLQLYRPDLKIKATRGGLEAHLMQLEAGEFEGLVVAATDAERLGWQEKVSEIFTTEVCVPWPGQGALALEVLAERTDLRDLLAALDDKKSHAAVVAERAWLAELGDDDDLPGGALANTSDGQIVMEAVVIAVDGTDSIQDQIEGPARSAEALGAKLAVRMLDRGAEDLLAAFRGDGSR
ncbi:MAG: hydroxymethylbilane synthase [Candidatus Eisenbacteria bacterium]|uniref:Hydroxymethylbilane synthase n=1 Tax=Eiseniibacteriota bacterium TaxID=2212470 RepID=A0A849SHV4_UNCEI|nr:hydroxymethylbilane synthase [Candidatus Eisenbacteria bacterium]